MKFEVCIQCKLSKHCNGCSCCTSRPVIETAGAAPVVPYRETTPPLTRAEFHALGPGRLATRVSWQNDLLGGRETYRIGYAAFFGWSVLRDWPGWYADVLTSRGTYEGCARYITDCIRPGRAWSGEDIQVEGWC